MNQQMLYTTMKQLSSAPQLSKIVKLNSIRDCKTIKGISEMIQTYSFKLMINSVFSSSFCIHFSSYILLAWILLKRLKQKPGQINNLSIYAIIHLIQCLEINGVYQFTFKSGI